MTSSLQQQSGKKFFFHQIPPRFTLPHQSPFFQNFFFFVPTSYIPISRRLSKDLGTISKRYLIEVGHVKRRGSQAPLRSIPPLPKTNESLQVNPLYILPTFTQLLTLLGKCCTKQCKNKEKWKLHQLVYSSLPLFRKKGHKHYFLIVSSSISKKV